MTGPALVAVVLTDAQRDIIAKALADAIAWRAPDTCVDCSRGAQCDDHARDVQIRALYWDLAAELGITPEMD